MTPSNSFSFLFMCVNVCVIECIIDTTFWKFLNRIKSYNNSANKNTINGLFGLRESKVELARKRQQNWGQWLKN